ncbi:TetR/AcrR family transcriptional regulator [Odoribacter sp. AF15-53]|uniref:TetR/AcrR family transcriptional regulator n=1 Tax=Odoribacter sp. AF15-53 TaxID=2292236 RepID=UPI000E494960|nr:TetR/AcrR family transcriptional regulator [Odoribacter sp. AF15-53]RHR75295.1 TetR/AcrR family transcriptional regulator [Odoribacter sp. AF15-53]
MKTQKDGGLIQANKRIRRSKDEIERDLSRAITKIITSQGFSKLTINNVSEAANVTKRVIYENYESFENLLKVYFIKNDFWTSFILAKIADKYTNYKDFFVGVLGEFFKAIDENPVFQCIIRWEVADPNDFVRSRAKNREISCADELQKNKKFFQQIGIDIEALYALLISGIYHLVLRKDISTFCNIDITNQEGKDRIVNIIVKLSELMFASFEKVDEKKRVIARLLNRGMGIEEIAEIMEVDKAFVCSIIELKKE